jgi:hypothetical protein
MGGLHGSEGDILLEEASTKMKYETLIFSPSCQCQTVSAALILRLPVNIILQQHINVLNPQ